MSQLREGCPPSNDWFPTMPSSFPFIQLPGYIELSWHGRSERRFVSQERRGEGVGSRYWVREDRTGAERVRERNKQRETDRQTDRQTNREKDR